MKLPQILQLLSFAALFLSNTNMYCQIKNFSQIHFSEIHFHPVSSLKQNGDTIKSKNYEFVELRNKGDEAINLFGCKIKGGIRYEFKEDDVIKANEYFVIAEDKKHFNKRYGFKADGRYKGKLSNNGETIFLVDVDKNIIDEVEYYDNYDWTEGADGKGKSLALIPSADNANALSWATLKEGSSPKKANLNFNQAYKLTFFKVTNVTGKVLVELYEKEIIENDFNKLSTSWPNGVYIIELIQNDKLILDYYVKNN